MTLGNYLRTVLDEFTYKPGWSFDLNTLPAKTVHYSMELEITAETTESGGRFAKPRNNTAAHTLYVKHTFPFYPQQFESPEDAMRFLLDCIIKVETHEAMEFFTIGDPMEGGGKPFFPQHGPLDEYDAYAIPKPWSVTL